jgi:sensor histidine kinase YesM
LLENAIKHNELTRESPLTLTIRNDGDRIKVTNNLQLKSTTEASTGSGLSNLSERYRIISNDELIIENDGKAFSVSIKILSNENSNN